jgi:hypothetical protein
LRGEAIVLPVLVRRDGRLILGAQAWVCYSDSPVGAYDEYALATVTRVGESWKSWGPHVIEMAVTSEHSMRCGRANWGFPKVLREMKYLRVARRVVFSHQGRERRFYLSRWSIPVAAPTWCVQVLERRAVRVPMFIKGRARLCWSGRRVGVCVEDFSFEVAPPQAV